VNIIPFVSVSRFCNQVAIGVPSKYSKYKVKLRETPSLQTEGGVSEIVSTIKPPGNPAAAHLYKFGFNESADTVVNVTTVDLSESSFAVIAACELRRSSKVICTGIDTVDKFVDMLI